MYAMVQQTPQLPRSAGMRTASTPRILLVEDNDINRLLLGEYLGYLGYQVLELPDGSNFFSALFDFQPHLVLLDLKLPGIDGYTLLQQLQQKPEWQHVPVIVVSAYAFQCEQQRALDLGARRYFVKPVNLPLLQQAIQEEVYGLAEKID